MASTTHYRCSLCGDEYGTHEKAEVLIGVKWNPGDRLVLTPRDIRDKPHHLCVKCLQSIADQCDAVLAQYPDTKE